MKEKYMKPCLVTESFELSQSIATSCIDTGLEPNPIWGPTANDPGSCVFMTGDGRTLFAAGPACSVIYGEGGPEISIFCYNNPSGGIPVFGS